MQLQIHRRNIVFDFPWSSCHQRPNLLLTLTLSKFWSLIYWISFLFHIWKNNIHSELLGKKVIILESICKILTKKYYVQIMEGYPYRNVIEGVPSLYIEKKALLISHLIENICDVKNKCNKTEIRGKENNRLNYKYVRYLSSSL